MMKKDRFLDEILQIISDSTNKVKKMLLSVFAVLFALSMRMDLLQLQKIEALPVLFGRWRLLKLGWIDFFHVSSRTSTYSSQYTNLVSTIVFLCKIKIHGNSEAQPSAFA
jgi:hypothetical protein